MLRKLIDIDDGYTLKDQCTVCTSIAPMFPANNLLELADADR